MLANPGATESIQFMGRRYEKQRAGRSFEKMADILEFKGENPFKISAYRKASRIIGILRKILKRSPGKEN